MPVQCQFNEHGCNVELLKASIGAHEKECSLRLVQCPAGGTICNEKLPLSKLIHHIKNHPNNGFLDMNTAATRTMRQFSFKNSIPIHASFPNGHIGLWGTFYCMYDDNIFFYHTWRNPQKIWFNWISMLGTQKQSDDYVCSIKIYSEENVSWY